MKKTGNKIKLLIGLMLLGITLAVFLTCNHQIEFTGNRIKNPDAYLLDAEKMNGTDQHTLDLQKGDVLQVSFQTARGSMHMEIKAPDGTAIYSGNGKEATGFTINIPQSGTYIIQVEARQAKGTIHIQLP